jgi:hypothetical protein
MFDWLRRWLGEVSPTYIIERRPLIVGVRPGDDIVLSGGELRADEDAFAVLKTVQAQFPASRIHLLLGFGEVQVARREYGSDGDGGADKHRPQPGPLLHDAMDEAAVRAAKAGEQGNVVLLRHCAGGRIVAVSIPPEQQGQPVG